jgi:TAG lipase/steryl ester hydrolase/phospholipase A2/LPA acyltransferase
LREWLESAEELDELCGSDEWKETAESDEYDFLAVKSRLETIDTAMASDDVGLIIHTLRTSLDRGIGGIMNPTLYTHSRIGTKDLIDEYVSRATNLVSRLLQLAGRPAVGLTDSLWITNEVEFARQAFGRTALLLSGGATFGMHHIGVVKALWETRLLPRIISGASAGSIVSAVLCASTDEEIPGIIASFGEGDFSVFESDDALFDPARRLRRFFSSGCLFDNDQLVRVLKSLLGNMTFKEAYNRTRRILNICVSHSDGHQLPYLLNFVTAPDVVIWSAV